MKKFAIDSIKKITEQNLDDQNIIKLTDEYLAKPEYSNLRPNRDHVRWLIDGIVHKITLAFAPHVCRSQKIQLDYTDIMRKMPTKKFTDAELESLPNQPLIEVCLFSEGWEESITKCFKHRGLSQEDPAQYKKFVQEVTKDQIYKITKEIRDNMSHTGIYADDDENNMANTRFTDRFPKKTVSFANIATESKSFVK